VLLLNATLGHDHIAGRSAQKQFDIDVEHNRLHTSAGNKHISREIKGSLSDYAEHRYAPHNDVSVNDGPHIRQWYQKIII
jgi:hypothetical protein